MNTPTAQTRSVTRPILAAAAIAGLGLALIMSVKPVLGTEPTYVASENVNSCEDLGVSGDGWSLDASVVQSGTHTYTSGAWTITITSDATKTHFDFSAADPLVLKLAVKAGNGYNLYSYSPPGVSHDEGLLTPSNGGNGQQTGLSHFFICFGGAVESVAQSAEQSVAQSADESAAQSVAQSVAQSGEGNVEAGTGTPAGSQPNTSLMQGAAGFLPTVAFSLLLLGSLGALAFANVKAARSRN